MIEELRSDPLIHSIANEQELQFFLHESPHVWGCLKTGDINTLEGTLEDIRKVGKRVFIHLDSIKGIGKDKEGIEYLAAMGVEAVITMKSQYIRTIREAGLYSVLGSFLVDSSAVTHTLLNIKTAKPDLLLIMPMSVPGMVYKRLVQSGTALIAGGLGTDHEVVQNALDHGAIGCIITSRERLSETYTF